MEYRRLTLAVLVGAMLLGSCTSAASSAAVTSEGQAARLALAQDARFAGIGPRDAELIGQAAWYEVAGTGDGWQVRIRIGWGDCPAGCISEHTWVYAVSRSGDVALTSDDGDPLPGAAGVRGVVVAGPTCPVVTDPPDPSCADRPVDGAVLRIVDESGTEVASVTSAADGTFAVSLAPGAYRLVPQPMEGLMGTAGEQAFTVAAGEPMAELTIAYDTGIR